MTGSIALDVVIGLVFIYTLYSLLTTTIVELIAAYSQLRARNLAKGIERMLDDDDKQSLLSKKFYETPLIKYMSKGSRFSLKKPSYIHSRNFVKALIYVLKNEEVDGETTFEMVRKSVEDFKDPVTGKFLKDTETGKLLIEFLNESENNLEKFKKSLETWFNDTMDRVGGWYKRRITLITFLVGFAIATIFNVDTFQIATSLSKDPKLREQYLQMAGNMIKDSTLMTSAYDKGLADRLKADTVLVKKFASNTKALNDFIADSVGKEVLKGQKILMDRMDSLEAYTQETQDVLTAKRVKGKGFIFNSWKNLWGCLVTSIAISLGAPFWFDLLSRLMKLRGGVAKSEEKKEKIS
ncbi:MAG: hypothetical protein HXX16_16245 [Bacteroidales bacterium]|nr:hypothetical protein [Bacteroidales bacterium]